VRRLAAGVSGRDLMRLFRLMGDAQEQLLRSPYPDLLLEMAVIRMATLEPVLDADELLRAIGNAGPSGRGGAGATTSQAPPVGSAPPAPTLSEAGARRIPVSGEVKAEAPRRVTPGPTIASAGPPTEQLKSAGQIRQPTAGLIELREFIRARRAALAGFMEQGAALELNEDLLIVAPRNDIYIRYLRDNRSVIAELASELYGKPIRAEVAPLSSGTRTVPDESAAAPISALPTPPDTQANSQSGPTIAAVGSANDPPQTQAEARKALFADPIARRIFDEFEARLVEVRLKPALERSHVEEPETEKK
jgi:DNA polymerase III subunit gamma/tau